MTKSCLQPRIKGKQSAAHTEWKPVPHDTPEVKERAFKNNVLTELFLASHQKTFRFFSDFCMTNWMTVIMFHQMFSVLIIFSVMQLENVKTVPVFCTTKWTTVVMFCQMFFGDSPENILIVFFQNATSKFQDSASFCVTKWMTVVMFCLMFSGDSLENVLIVFSEMQCKMLRQCWLLHDEMFHTEKHQKNIWDPKCAF